MRGAGRRRLVDAEVMDGWLVALREPAPAGTVRGVGEPGDADQRLVLVGRTRVEDQGDMHEAGGGSASPILLGQLLAAAVAETPPGERGISQP